MFDATVDLPVGVLDVLPNPVLVKDADTRYVWVNAAFERLFSVDRSTLVGCLDAEVFQARQAVQCNGGDLRVLASGEIDEATETVIDPELGERETITRKSRLTIDGVHYLVGVMHDITEVSDKNRKLAEIGEALADQASELKRLASTDPLTGSLNRRALFDAATSIWAEEQSVGVIAFDLDRFKAINDRHGHEAGDAVLARFTEVTREVLRKGDLLARTGGEEFVAILPGASAIDTGDIAERIRVAVADSEITYRGDAIAVTTSVGAVTTTDPSTAPFEDVLRVADSRLYSAKSNGRNQVVSA